MTSPNSILCQPVQFVKGVGPKRAALLEKLGLKTVRDLIFHFPARYEDRANLKSISQINIDEMATVRGTVRTVAVSPAGRNTRNKIFEAAFADRTGVIRAIWFHFHEKTMVNKFAIGSEWIISGKVTTNKLRGNRTIVHPDVEPVEADEAGESLNLGRIVPIYPLTEGLTQKALRYIIHSVLAHVGELEDFVPETLNQQYKLPPLRESVGFVHWPAEGASVDALSEFQTRHQKKLIFDEFFLIQSGLALKRRMIRQTAPEAALNVDAELLDKIRAVLPFKLTGAQERVLLEIAGDLASDRPMNRLLQGDVGSGKTAVALAAALIVARNKKQTAIMAPTEILANQHYRNITKILRYTKVKVELVTSGSRDKGETLARARSGESHIVIGTHALIQEGVDFHHLGLAIIDEQHRFGVRQRAELIRRGVHVHALIMTATPIPRTLAMTLYGDLDISTLDESPPGRGEVVTGIYTGAERMRAMDIVRKEVKKGRQAYIIYPLVEESEKMELKAATEMYERLSAEDFAGLRLGLTHGRMKSEEKEEAMARFGRGEIDILVSTVVIEVGIDFPNATVMMIEHAERFGLSQLHQLRGRIGRGKHASYCLLMAECHRGAPAWERLKILEKYQDGFKIAEEDMQLRGSGDFFGVKQSGLPQFKIGDVLRDFKILAEARKSAFAIVEGDPHLTMPAHKPLARALKENWKDRFELGDIG
jgi:ATP-dependent DNA helicase RecG